MKNEKLVYQMNALPAAIAISYLVFNTWQTIITLNSINVIAEGLRVMQIILLNILLSFMVFIISFEIKRYSVKWSWIGVCAGIFQTLRVFFIPESAAGSWLNIAVSLLAGGILLIIASVWSLVMCKKYRQAVKELECLT